MRVAGGGARNSGLTTRRLSAVLVADVVGYRAQMEHDDAGTLARLRAMRGEVVDPAMPRMAAASSRRPATGSWSSSPASFMRSLRGRDPARRCRAQCSGAEDKRIDFRIGINVGDIIVDGDDIFGDGVNIAARLEGACGPGGICISQAVRDQVRDKLRLAFADLGEQTVKNIGRPIVAYMVDLGGGPRAVRGTAEPRAMSIGVRPFAVLTDDATIGRRAKAIERDFGAMLARCGG